MADPRDELTLADIANEPGFLPPREPLRIRVSPYDTPPPSDTGWGGFGAGGRPTGRLFEPDLSQSPTEASFQQGIRATPWFSEFRAKFGEEPNLDDPNYDYRKAWAAGARPDVRDPGDNLLHWSSQFKGENHPNRYVNGVDTITGQPVQPQKPTFQPGLLSLGNVARGIGSLVQGAKDAWNAPPQPAGPPVSMAPPLVPPGRGRSNAPFDPLAGVRPAEGYPNATPATNLGGVVDTIGHAATEVLQEPYNLVRAGQDVRAPGATDQQVQQAREQEAGAATNIATNLFGLNAPFARSASLGTGFAGPLWHGSSKKDLTVLNESTRGPLGPGVYTSPAEQISKGLYAGPEGTVYKLPEKNRDIYLGHGHRTDQEWFGFKNDKERLLKAAEPDKKDELSKILDKMWSSDGYPTYQRVRQLYGGDEGAQALFKKAGFGGISGLIDGPEVLLFGPQVLRKEGGSGFTLGAFGGSRPSQMGSVLRPTGLATDRQTAGYSNIKGGTPVEDMTWRIQHGPPTETRTSMPVDKALRPGDEIIPIVGDDTRKLNQGYVTEIGGQPVTPVLQQGGFDFALGQPVDPRTGLRDVWGNAQGAATQIDNMARAAEARGNRR